MSQRWVSWVTELQAIAQNGLTFATSPFDTERYQSILNIAADMASRYTEVDASEVLPLFFDDSRYKTPNLDVRGAVFEGDKLLLVQENSGLWTMPGGWADVNTSPAENVEREVLEESGLIVKAKKMVGLYDKLKHEHPPEWPHAYKAFFLCERVDGTLKTSIETQAVGFFGLEELPPLCPNRMTLRQIQRCYEHYHNSDLPTEFD